MLAIAELEKILKREFPGGPIAVRDLTRTLDHFEVMLVSEKFRGLNLVEQHQMVYRALKEEMKGAIHALTLKTYDPETWQAVKSNESRIHGIS